MSYKVLFLGRNDCNLSKRLHKILKKISKVKFIKSKYVGEKINWNSIIKKNYDFIFCFRSYFILPKAVLNSVNIAAINFHPGPLKYRGFGGINFAILNKEKKYGCTAHIINEEIDNGPVLKQKTYTIANYNNLDEILEKTHKELFKLANDLITKIIKNNKILYNLIKLNKKSKWSKKIYKKKDLDNLYKIKVIGKNFTQILKATYCKNFQPVLQINKSEYKIIKL